MLQIITGTTPYAVDLSGFQKSNPVKNTPFLQMINAIMQRACIAMKAIWEQFSWEVIQRNFLGIPNSSTNSFWQGKKAWLMISTPLNFAALVSQVSFGILITAYEITITFPTLFFEELPSNRSSRTFDEALNQSHIFSHIPRNFDLFSIPEEINLQQIFRLFCQINFSDENTTCYFSPLSITRDGVSHQPIDLKDGLLMLLRNIKQRKAFIGTPPEDKKEELEAFYLDIEKQLKWTLWHIQKEEEEFKKQHGYDCTLYEEEVKKTYAMILETKGQFAIDLAFAGIKCGGAYQSTATEWALRYIPENKMTSNMQQVLWDILAEERLVIAKEEAMKIAQNIMLSDAELETHVYNQYLATMSQYLKFPVPAQIHEHLYTAQKLSMHPLIKDFSLKYTPLRLIQIIKKQFRTNETFQHLVHEWIKSQCGDWRKNNFEKLKEECLSLFSLLIKANDQDSIQKGIGQIYTICNGTLQQEAISRLLENPIQANEILSQAIERSRLADFLNQVLMDEQVDENSDPLIPKKSTILLQEEKLLEWLLVTNGVLYAQHTYPITRCRS